MKDRYQTRLPLVPSLQCQQDFDKKKNEEAKLLHEEKLRICLLNKGLHWVGRSHSTSGVRDVVCLLP